MRTLQDLAREALAVQDACNLSGVAHSFAKAISALWEIATDRGEGTQWVNTHPITIAWVDKMASLAGTQGYSDVASAAYRACGDLVAGIEPAYSGKCRSVG